jgi:hypothetical protein
MLLLYAVFLPSAVTAIIIPNSDFKSDERLYFEIKTEKGSGNKIVHSF